VRSKWARISWVVLLLSLMVGSAAMALGTSYDLGEEIQFKVQDSTTWWWGCCSCEGSSVSGWRIVNASGQVVYSVVHDAAVPSSLWQGSWLQLDLNGIAVAAGQYTLYVDTSVGPLSRCFTVRDPCACNWCTSSCTSCVCEEVTSITNCACRTALVFVTDCVPGCFPFFRWGCNSTSTSTGCSSCP